MENNNPLLDVSGWLRCNEIKPEHIKPAVDYMLNCNRNQIAKLDRVQRHPDLAKFYAAAGIFIRSPSAFVGACFPFEQCPGSDTNETIKRIKNRAV